jgi:hypothetical protein
MSRNNASGRARQWFVAALVCLAATAAMACGEMVAESSACRNLVYKDGEVPRAQYLPCAGEMVSALEELDRQTEAAFNGDQQARSDGQSTLRRMIGLMKAAGGRQLLERWDDRALMDLNVDIHNAVTHYQAFYMVRILEEPNQFAATSREAARNEFIGGRRRFNEASQLYRRLK